MAADRMGHNEPSDLSRFWVKGHGQLLGDTLMIDISIFVCRCDISFRRYAVSSAERRKSLKWSKILCFLRSKFGGGALQNFGGAFVNRCHFRLTGQVWLRSHGRSFIYADEIKISAVKYNGLAFDGITNNLRLYSFTVVIY